MLESRVRKTAVSTLARVDGRDGRDGGNSFAQQGFPEGRSVCCQPGCVSASGNGRRARGVSASSLHNLSKRPGSHPLSLLPTS